MHSNSYNQPLAALQKLQAGNLRYRTQGPFHQADSLHRKGLLEGQHPFAAVLACSDSRVPPEIVFDQRLGDLFVIRSAGHVLDDTVLGSLEFALVQLRVPLVVVLGHENCGAVTAALSLEPVGSHLAHLLESIRPGLDQVRSSGGDAVAIAVEAHIRVTVASLKREALFAEHLKQGKLKIVGLHYNLGTGTLTAVAD
jgi:carbonic anhydrase